MASRRGPSGRIMSSPPDSQNANDYGYSNETQEHAASQPSTPTSSSSIPSSVLSPSSSSLSSVDDKQENSCEKKLRKPKIDPKSVSVNSSPKTQDSAILTKPNCDPRLTVKAPEFIPKPSKSSLSSHSTNPSALELPMRMQDLNLSQLSPEPEFFPEEDIHPLVTYLNDMIFSMTIQPGRFEPIAQRIISTINRHHVVTEVLHAIADTICVQSIVEPNFCYNGARLCQLLSLQLITNSEDSFRGLILKRCQLEHRSREDLILHSPERVQGLAMFMGELFLHLELQTANMLGSRKIGVLGKSLVELLQTLIESREQNNLKCACQVLKLTGAVLEDEERAVKNGLAPSMDSLIEKLKSAALDSNVPRRIKDLMLKIVELRASDWGRVVTSPVVLSDPVMAEYPTDPFYGIPELEDADAYNYDDSNSEDGEWDVDGEPGMDDEMEAAFEEFLRSSK